MTLFFGLQCKLGGGPPILNLPRALGMLRPPLGMYEQCTHSQHCVWVVFKLGLSDTAILVSRAILKPLFMILDISQYLQISQSITGIGEIHKVSQYSYRKSF